MEQFADFLEVLCKEGPRLFYEGEIARRIESEVSGRGGFLRESDLKAYKVIDRAPIHFELNGFDVFTNPPPSAGGTILKLIFDNLWSDQLKDEKTGPEWLNLVCNTFQKVQDLRNSAGKIEEYQDKMYPKSQWGSTTHLSVVDEHGNAAAISTTNGQGAGYTVPGTQVMLNNMLGEGALFPLGFHTWEEDKRVPSMMSPTVVRNPKTETRIAMGTGGAGRIPYSIAHVMINLVLGEGFGKAIDHPRIYLENGTLSHEPGIEMPASLPKMVNKVVSWDQNDMFFGGVHTVVKSEEKIKAIGDKRRHGIVEYVR
jgi:gamma-glutamyltranspeptidase/glutathione hydrolase